jgi:hypothetical protein
VLCAAGWWANGKARWWCPRPNPATGPAGSHTPPPITSVTVKPDPVHACRAHGTGHPCTMREEALLPRLTCAMQCSLLPAAHARVRLPIPCSIRHGSPPLRMAPRPAAIYPPASTAFNIQPLLTTLPPPPKPPPTHTHITPSHTHPHTHTCWRSPWRRSPARQPGTRQWS